MTQEPQPSLCEVHPQLQGEKINIAANAFGSLSRGKEKGSLHLKKKSFYGFNEYLFSFSLCITKCNRDLSTILSTYVDGCILSSCRGKMETWGQREEGENLSSSNQNRVFEKYFIFPSHFLVTGQKNEDVLLTFSHETMKGRCWSQKNEKQRRETSEDECMKYFGWRSIHFSYPKPFPFNPSTCH